MLGVEFVAGTKNCYCLLSTDQNVMFTIGNSNTASKSPAAGFYTMFVGTCSSYPLVNNTIYPCQTVTYPIAGGCIGIDGTTACKCIGSVNCDSSLGTSSVWYVYNISL